MHFQHLKSFLAIIFAFSTLVSAQVSFERHDYPAGLQASWVVTGDFNNDGIPDLLVVNNGGCVHSCVEATVSVLLGNGDGTFQAPITSDVGGPFFTGFAALGDFNKDVNLDVVVEHSSGYGLSTLLGNGDGSFQPPVLIYTGFSPGRIHAVDVRGNGNLDLVGLRNLQDGFVMLGNGNGTFQDPMFFDLGVDTSSELANHIALADFNGDDIPDLAVTITPRQSGGSGSLVVLLGNGDGTFKGSSRYDFGNYFPAEVATADLNNDGIMDLAVTAGGQSGLGGSVFVLLGNGDATFQRPKAYSSPGCGSIASGDFDNDGNMDVALTSCRPDPPGNTVLVLLGDGQGGLGEPISFEAGFAPNGITAEDFNFDGKLDLAVSNFGSNSVSVLLNNTCTRP